MSTDRHRFLILVADNDDKNRQYVAGILSSHGYRVMQAVDGGSAMKVVNEHPVDVAIIEYGMRPFGGLDFARHCLISKLDTGIVMITDDPTTDLLLEAGKLEIKQLMRKPVDPARLAETVRRVLRASGKDKGVLYETENQALTPDELMRRALALAGQNAQSRMGGPFGAVVADAQGRVLGEGVNSVTARCDPTAHAEVMAIKRATERLKSTRLDGCVMYASSEPTMLGQALIISTGIARVFYGLSHDEIGAVRASEKGILGEIRKPLTGRAVPYERLGHDEALALFNAWRNMDRKIAD